MPYDLFISYSRRDNEQSRITQLVERIKTDFAPFAKREFVPFFDQQEINGMSDWRQRILQGLRESRLLLACLSPAYLESEYCEWEFVEYLKYEIGHLHGFNGVAPIYFVQVPGWDDKDFNQKCAAWIAELRRRQNFDLRPWFHAGEDSLRETSVRERMGKLNARIVEIITKGERAEKSLGNVDAHNPHFIGRTANLRMLRDNFVEPGHIGVVTSVNGVGGLGKTALAIEYAHAFADEYGGGRWQVRCAGKDDLRLALAELATPIGFEFTDDEKKNADLQFERTRRELKKLADAPTVFPLLGGEGQGEGELPTLPKLTNTTPRLAFLRHLIALLESQPDAPFLGQLKTLLTGPELPMATDVAVPWDIAYFIAHLNAQLGAPNAEFLTALVAAMNDSTEISELEKFPEWRNQPSIPLNVPWP